VIPIASARVAFAGTPDFAVASLKALIDVGVTIECVLTQPDRRAGRGRERRASAVKQLALASAIDVVQPALLDDALRARLSRERPDILIVVAYGLILPGWMLEWPKIAAVNVHASLLPRWRGAAPIQRAILAGDHVTGVSIMRITQGLDCGPVYRQAGTAIDPAETAGQLQDRLAGLGARLLIEVLPEILAGTAEPEPQNDEEATYAPKIEKREAAIDWRRSAIEIERQVRAFDPWPVAETSMPGGGRLRIFRAECLEGSSDAAAGTVVATAGGAIDVATGDGVLRVTQVQPPGGRIMSAAAYLAARDLRGVRFVGSD
jgi:methionyl-tRNA formyltransferase